MSPFGDQFEPYGPGHRAPIGSVTSDDLKRLFRGYRRNVAKRYRVVFPESIHKFLPDETMWISTKVDGELWYLVKEGDEVALCAYNGRVLKGVPVTDEAQKLLAGTQDIVIAGELFAIPTQENVRPRVHHVARALADDTLAPTLGFKAFDLVREGEKDWQDAPYSERLERLNGLVNGKRVAVVNSIEGGRSQAATSYQDWVTSEKFEGLVVRSPQGVVYKIKPHLTLDVVVLAFGERAIDGVRQIRELTVGLRRDDGSFQILGTVGTGFSGTDRMEWHQKLTPLEVSSTYRMANREGTLCRFVRPEVIIEVKCSDLVSLDSKDAPVRRMALRYDKESGFEALGNMPFVSMLHPVYLREREDKDTDLGAVGLDQVFRHVPFDDRDSEVTPDALPHSEVIKRGVYIKETKGKVAVPKYVALATHKSDEDPDYPPFVVHFTDYSPGRKEPLQTSLKVASTPAAVDEHLAIWLEANIKRGWKSAQEMAEAT